MFKFSETTGLTEAKFHVAPPLDREKMQSLLKLFRSFVVSHNCQYPGAGAFSRNFTTNLAP